MCGDLALFSVYPRLCAALPLVIINNFACCWFCWAQFAVGVH